jgi:hypothetical protein
MSRDANASWQQRENHTVGHIRLQVEVFGDYL